MQIVETNMCCYLLYDDPVEILLQCVVHDVCSSETYYRSLNNNSLAVGGIESQNKMNAWLHSNTSIVR